MTWPLPQPAEIAEAIAADLIAAFPGTAIDPRAPDTMVGVLSRSVALTAFDLHLALRYLASELMVDTAQDNLPRHADVWAIPRIAATYASRTVTLTGADGTVIPTNTRLLSPAGVLFRVLGDTTIASGTTFAAVRAETPGTIGNATIGTVLQLVTPIAGLAPQSGTVETIIGQGADEEEVEAWRARILARIRQPPMGGAAADYAAWARGASSDVTGVRVYPNHVGPGTVGVVVAMRGDEAPTSGELSAIAAAIDAVRPVTAEVFVLACVPTAVPFSIALTPDTPANRAAVSASLDAFFAREAAIGTGIPRSRLSEAISAAPGEFSHVMSVPSADVAPTALQLPIRGTITWVT